MAPQHIIVTGAAQGIGRAITEICLRQGIDVHACDLNPSALKTLEKEMNSPKLHTSLLDVSDYASVAEFLETPKQPFDGLVNNAGIFPGKKLIDYSPEEIDRVLNINLKGCVYFSQLFAKTLLQKETYGVIVNITSVAAHVGSSDPLYGASKAGIVGLTKSCAMNFAPYVRVNAVAPGIVDTDLVSAIPQWRMEEYNKAELIKERIQPQDVAEAVWFLLGDTSHHITGATLDVNNGFCLR